MASETTITRHWLLRTNPFISMFRDRLPIVSEHDPALLGSPRKQGRVFAAGRPDILGYQDINVSGPELNSS